MRTMPTSNASKITALVLLAAVSLQYCIHADEVFNAAAIKINERTVSVREVENLFADSQVLIKDKLRKGELSPDALGDAVRMAWTEAIETATQDKILDYRAEKLRKDIMHSILSRAGEGGASGERALDYFNREVAFQTRRLRRAMITAAGGEEELRAALKRRNQTLQEWDDGVQLEFFRRQVLAMELGPVTTSPAAARAFFEKHPELFSQQDSWRLRRIRILKSKFTSADIARNAATLARQKIMDGTDFAAIASKVSDDPDYSGSGGMLVKEGNTDLPSGTFPGEEQIAEKLKDGEISEPIDAGDWYVLVQRVAYNKGAVQTFEKAAERAEALAYNEKLKQKKKEMFEKLKNQSYIEVLQKDPPAHLLNPVKAAPDQFVAPNK